MLIKKTVHCHRGTGGGGGENLPRRGSMEAAPEGSAGAAAVLWRMRRERQAPYHFRCGCLLTSGSGAVRGLREAAGNSGPRLGGSSSGRPGAYRAAAPRPRCRWRSRAGSAEVRRRPGRGGGGLQRSVRDRRPAEAPRRCVPLCPRSGRVAGRSSLLSAEPLSSACRAMGSSGSSV